MSVSTEQLETFKQKIIDAFGNIPYPKGFITNCVCEECLGVRRAFLNKEWKEIKPNVLEENYDKLPLFSPEAFHCFLPAYLIYSLEHFEDKDSNVSQFTIYTLTPDKAIKENPSWWQERFKHFTPEQFNLIYDFLDLAKENEEFDDFTAGIERGKDRLKEFIEPTLKPEKLLKSRQLRRKKRSR